MPITEIALLRVKNPNKYGDAILKLFHAAEEQWRWSLYPVRAFRQVEDPTLVYLFGGWKSVVAHLEDWLPSAQNKAALESIKEYLEIVWMFHVDIEPCKHLGILNAPSIAINRYFVKRSRKSDFGALFKVRQTRLEEIADDPDPNFTGGWRIDNYGGDEEFFFLSNWEDAEQHATELESNRGYYKFTETKTIVANAEIKHATFVFGGKDTIQF